MGATGRSGARRSDGVGDGDGLTGCGRGDTEVGRVVFVKTRIEVCTAGAEGRESERVGARATCDDKDVGSGGDADVVLLVVVVVVLVGRCSGAEGETTVAVMLSVPAAPAPAMRMVRAATGFVLSCACNCDTVRVCIGVLSCDTVRVCIGGAREGRGGRDTAAVGAAGGGETRMAVVCFGIAGDGDAAASVALVLACCPRW